jgi:flagellar secretion chaperone FliS
MSPQKLSQYQAYNTATLTVPKVQQIVMLYDGAIRYLQQAKEAVQENRIEDRYNLLVKASDIVIGLQSCLDFEAGGEIAKILYDYYSGLDARIFTIHRSNSVDMCERVINDLKLMRDTWQEIAGKQSEDSGKAASRKTADMPVAPKADDKGLQVSA